MKKEDFKYGDKEKKIEGAYIYEDSRYLLIIARDIFTEETISYANHIVELYLQSKDAFIKKMLDMRLRESYKYLGYNDEYIRNNLGRPQIAIEIQNRDQRNFQFRYYGIISYLEHHLDEHVIEAEFQDNLNILHVVLNG